MDFNEGWTENFNKLGWINPSAIREFDPIVWAIDDISTKKPTSTVQVAVSWFRLAQKTECRLLKGVYTDRFTNDSKMQISWAFKGIR